MQAQDTAAIVVLPAVHVNALRTGLVLERAPISVSVLGPQRTLGRGPSLAVGEALHGLTGVVVDDRHNQALGERLSIRGFGARSTFGVRGIRVLVDGIPATMPDGQTTMNHVDPAQIVGAELVRGAAGAFLGNAAGGALHLRTGAPATGIEAVGGAGSLRRLKVSAAAGSGSAFASWQRLQGFRAHSESERTVVGGVLTRTTRAGLLDAALHGAHYQAENPGSLTIEQVAADARQANPGNVRQRTSERGTHAQLGIGWRHVIGRLELEARAHGGVRDVVNPIPPRIIELDRTFGGLRVQGSLATWQVRLALGGELELQRDARLNYVNEEGVRGALALNQRERVRGTALFLHARWTPVEAVQLFSAVRRDAYRFVVRDRLIDELNADDSGRRTLSATSAAAGAGIGFSEGVELIANLSTAFETPTTTELANQPDGSGGFNPELEPERTVSGEVGLRAQRAHWSAEAIAFRAEVRDKLIPFEVPAMPGRQFFRNAGRARHQGIELSGTGRPLPALELRAAYSRLDVRFRDYLSGGDDLSGRKVPGTPSHRLDIEADARLGSVQLLLRGRRNGRVTANDANTASAPAYTLFAARVAHVGVAAGPLEVALHAGVENLLGSSYTAAVAVNAAGARYYEPGPGRSAYFGVSIARRSDQASGGIPAGR